MLKQVRRSMSRVMALFFVVPLVLAFSLWGVPELRSFTQQAPLRVGKTGFSSQTLLQEFNQQMTQRRNQRNGVYTREDALAEGLPEFVVSSVATRSVLKQEADKLGLVMPRALVRDYLHADERFQNPATGKFDQFGLQSILQANSLSVRQFEAILKEDLLRDQLVDSVAAGGGAPREFVQAMLLREVERRRVGYLTITDDMAGIPAEPTPDDLKTYYDENTSLFMAPEYRSFTAVILRYSDFREGLEVADDELRKLYEANKPRLYDTPEKRTIYQITYDSEGEAAAAAAALRQGKPFESLATEKGLTLGAVTFTEIQEKDILDPSVAAAAFAPGLLDGDVPDPVKSLFGWTVVQLAGISPPSTKTFEEVREELVAQFLEADTRKRVLDVIDSLEEARDTGASLGAAAEQAGAVSVQFGPVDRFSMAPGGVIAADIPAEMLEEAFTIDEGSESDAIELADGGYFFVQVDEVTPPTPRPFEEISDKVADRWRAEDRRRRIAEAVATVTNAVADGKTLEEAAAPFNRAVLEIVLERNTADESFSAGLVDRAFKSDQGSLISGPAGSSDAQTIVEVRQIGYARSRIGPGQEVSIGQFLTYQLNQEYLEAYVQSLREDYGVKVNQAAIAQIFNEGQ
jgi:peptidyl-prolyl cis-trans isomerase D